MILFIFNTSLSRGAVPTDWRQANVIPIFKKGEKYLASNYRPVSLTCISSFSMPLAVTVISGIDG
jgi:hypothetical protein